MLRIYEYHLPGALESKIANVDGRDPPPLEVCGAASLKVWLGGCK